MSAVPVNRGSEPAAPVATGDLAAAEETAVAVDVGRSPDGGGRPPRRRLAGDQAQLAHELADQLQAGLLAAADQGGVQTPVAVGGIVRLEQRLYLDFQQFPAPRGGAFRP